MHSLVTISPWVIKRQEGQWPQHHAFNPERFITSTVSTSSNYGIIDALFLVD